MKEKPLSNTIALCKCLSVLFPDGMKSKGRSSFISRGERSRGSRYSEWKRHFRLLVPNFTHKVRLPVGLNRPNLSFQRAQKSPGKDKLNWSPCHCSLSLTASCHGNKLDCCGMRPINCDVRRPAKYSVPNAIVNMGDFLVLRDPECLTSSQI